MRGRVPFLPGFAYSHGGKIVRAAHGDILLTLRGGIFIKVMDKTAKAALSGCRKSSRGIAPKNEVHTIFCRRKRRAMPMAG